MTRQIYVNLPVDDLQRSMAFFKALGFSFNPDFTNDQGACMIIAENIYAMLLTREFFATFTTREICDAKKSIEVLLCLSCESREQVDDTVARAVAAGGSVPREAKDHGFMYEHAFADPDGHIWELAYMAAGAQG